MLVEAAGLKPRDIVRVSFRLPTSEVPIEASGVVVWQTENRQGIRFTRLSPQNAEAINQFVT